MTCALRRQGLWLVGILFLPMVLSCSTPAGANGNAPAPSDAGDSTTDAGTEPDAGPTPTDAGAQPGQGITALVGVTVVHPEREDAQATEPDRVVLLRDGRIERVIPNGPDAVPEGATVVDAAGKWLIPGLVDSHVHFFQSGGPYTRPDVIDLTSMVPYADDVARNQARVEDTLRAWLAVGVTGVVDTGGPRWNFQVRQTAEELEAAPRVEVAGPLISTVPRPELDLGDPPIIQAETPEEAAALAREQLQFRPDFLKVWLIPRRGLDAEQRIAFMRAVADVADGAGIPLIVHATELELAKEAMRAGADILAHSVDDAPVDDEFIRLARENNVIYMTTLFVRRGYDVALAGEFEPTPLERQFGIPEVVRELEALGNQRSPPADHPTKEAVENLTRVWEAGITVAAGSDAGNIGTLHGPGFHRELAQLARAGLSPRQVLLAATGNGARVMGLENRLGRIAEGYEADLVLLDANPIASVDNLARIHRVIRQGRLYIPAQLAPRPLGEDAGAR